VGTDFAQLHATQGWGHSTVQGTSGVFGLLLQLIDGDGVIDRMPLFDGRLEDYFWQYDNNGLKLVQLRFYEIPTNVN
jgi:hypothetical protein